MVDERADEPRGEATFVVDVQNRVTRWNRHATALLGFEAEDVIDRPLAEVLSVWDETGNRYQVANGSLHKMAIQGEDIREFAVEIARSDGSRVPVICSVEVLASRSIGSHQLAFRLRPDRRKSLKDTDLEQMIRQALTDFEVSPAPAASSKASSPATPSLSERQVEVLSLLSEGMQCDSIAEALNLSVNTVRRHVQNAMERLDAHTQAEAVAKSIRLNLI